MDKYALINMFHCDRLLQFNMYAFIYVDPYTRAEEYYLPYTKIFVANYKRRPTPTPLPKYWLVFTYIH